MMINTTDIRDHMELVDSQGAHIGTIDGVEDGRVKLTRSDSPDGQHHYVEASALDRIEGGRLMLRQGAAMTEAQIAAASSHHAVVANPISGAASRPLFGTSGTGTGMGGSGAGEH